MYPSSPTTGERPAEEQLTCVIGDKYISSIV